MTIDPDYYINVANYMPLPRPRLRPTIYVTGWNEWLPLTIVECPV